MGDQEVVDQDLEYQEGGEQDEGTEAAGHSGDDGSGEPDEPFLTIDDRTVYKNKDAALEGFRNTKQYLGQYQKLGKPEDIARTLEENQRLKQALLGGDGKLTQAEKDELADLIEDPELRKKWKGSAPVIERLLKGKVVTHEEMAQQNEKRFRAATHLEFSDLGETLSESGVKLDRRAINRLEAIAVHAMQNSEDDPLGEKLVNAYNANDPKRFVRELLKDSYGEDALKGKTQPRTADGKFAAAARKEQGAKKASELPKAPPDGGGAPSGGGAEKKPSILGGGRIQMLKDKMAELRGRQGA